MFNNFLKIALRNLSRNKSFTFIALLSLALGLSSCMIILKFVISEVGYDRYHQFGDRLYRITIVSEQLASKESWTGAQSPILWGPALAQEYPQIEDYTRIVKSWEPLTLEWKGARFTQDNIYFAETSIFNLFTWPLLHGDAKTVFDHPYAAVVTEKTAKKYFQDENPIGQSFLLISQDRDAAGNFVENKILLTVTGIMKDVPVKTHLKPEMLVSFKSLNDIYGGDVAAGTHSDPDFWRWTVAYTYLLLKKDCPPQDAAKIFTPFMQKYIGDANISRGFTYKPYLQKIADIHLEKNVYSTPEHGGNRDILLLFSLIALAIALIACFNFMNLSTARAASRAKEVGVRKVIGCKRRGLIAQFLCESVILSCGALAVALMLVYLIEPLFSQYTGKDLALMPKDLLYYVATFLVLTFLVGLFAGSYPAFFLSSFEPAAVFKKTGFSSTKGILFRKGLVVMQFTGAILFIIAVFAVKGQLDFMKTSDLGFNKEQILVIPARMQTPSVAKMISFREELVRYPFVADAAFLSNHPGAVSNQDLWKETAHPDKAVTALYEIETDHHFFDLYGLKLVAGRNFSPLMGEDANTDLHRETETLSGTGVVIIQQGGITKGPLPKEVSIILNQEAVRRLNLGTPAQAVGKVLVRDPVSIDFLGRVVGVVGDFHFASLQHAIEPLVLYPYDAHDTNPYDLSIKISPIKTGNTISLIQQQWQKYFPSSPFDYFFLDEHFAKLYTQEEKLIHIFAYAAVLAVCIACIGLLGLMMHLAQQKTKEIGIRRVCGASVFQVAGLLCRNFVFLIFLATAIAVPVALYAINRWLQTFAYRGSISVWIFFAAAGLVMTIAIIVMSFHVIQAARANPVESLRYE